MRIFRTGRTTGTLRCAALAVALSALLTGVGMAGQQGGNQDAPLIAPAISLNRAGEIALEQVQGGTLVKSEYRVDQGRGGYTVHVIDGGARVEFKIDVSTGQIMSMERNSAHPAEYPGSQWGQTAPANPAGQAAAIQGGIDAARAREIALARAGGGTIVESDRDFKRGGRIVYEFEIAGPDRRYEIDVDGQTGAVVEYQEKRPRHGGYTWHHD